MTPKDRGHLPQVLDSTIVNEFVECPTKFYYSFIRRLGGVAPSVDLVAGGAFARGLEVTRLAYYGDKLPLAQSLERGMLAAVEAFGETEVPEFKSQKGVDRVVQALASYFEQYNPATDHIQPMFSGDGKPMVEFTFSVPLPINHPESGEPFIYAGRFDMVGLYNDQVVGVDEKTTTQLGPTWVNKWNLRGQFTGYTWALQQYGKPAIGMIVRGVSFLKNSFGHAEAIQQRPQWMIDQWYEQLLANVNRMVDGWHRGWFDQNFGETCAAYGGCGFQRLCTSAEPENWIAGHYGEREWNPLAKVPYTQPVAVTETVAAPEELLSLLTKEHVNAV